MLSSCFRVAPGTAAATVRAESARLVPYRTTVVARGAPAAVLGVPGMWEPAVVGSFAALRARPLVLVPLSTWTAMLLGAIVTFGALAGASTGRSCFRSLN